MKTKKKFEILLRLLLFFSIFLLYVRVIYPSIFRWMFDLYSPGYWDMYVYQYYNKPTVILLLISFVYWDFCLEDDSKSKISLDQRCVKLTMFFLFATVSYHCLMPVFIDVSFIILFFPCLFISLILGISLLFTYFFFYKLVKISEKHPLQKSDGIKINEEHNGSKQKKKILFLRDSGYIFQVMYIKGELEELEKIAFSTDEDLPDPFSSKDIESYDVLIFFGRSSLWKREMFKTKKKILLVYEKENRKLKIEDGDNYVVWEIDNQSNIKLGISYHVEKLSYGEIVNYKKAGDMFDPAFLIT